MRLLSLAFFCIVCLQCEVFGELSDSSCSLLRTATSISTIVPELAQLAMRYYQATSPSSSSDVHHRLKRFLFDQSPSKDGSGTKGSVLDQMVANTFKDVDFTKVALLILNNNETMNKIRQNVNGDVIIRAAMREIDYEKLGSSLWYAMESEFDLEYLVLSLINITHIDTVYDELAINGTLPAWLIKSIHPELNVRTVHRIIETLKDSMRKFAGVMNSSQRLDEYLFSTIQQQVLTPMGNIIQRVRNEKPASLDQLVEIVLNDVNKVVAEQFTTPKPVVPNKSSKKSSTKRPSTTTIAPLEETIHDDVKILLYQWSIVADSIGQTARVLFKALEELYCTSVWE